MQNLELFQYTEKLKSEWDNFVTNHPQGSIHQISDWKDFQTQIPGRETVYGYGVRRNGKILATTFCVQMHTGMGGKFWFYSARGPVWNPKKPDAQDAAEFLIKEVSQKLKEAGGIFWRIDPYINSSSPHPLGEGLGERVASQQYQPTDTLEIDLTQTEDEILSQMKRKGRYNIKIAKRDGVEIETIPKGKFTDQDLEDYWSLCTETTGRDGFSGHEKSYYKNFLSSLPENAVLFFATVPNPSLVKGEIEGIASRPSTRIATAIFTLCGTKSIYYFGASTSAPEYRKLMAPYLLQWEMMQYGKANGATTYDFLGIAPENEPKHAYAGITEFKLKFGGYRKTYSPGVEIPLNKLWYTAYKTIKKLKR